MPLVIMYLFLYLVSFPRHHGPYWRGLWTGAGKEPFLVRVPGWVALLCGRPFRDNILGFEHMSSQLYALAGLASLAIFYSLGWAGLVNDLAAKAGSVIAFVILTPTWITLLWIGETRLDRKRLADQALNLTQEDRRHLRKRRKK